MALILSLGLVAGCERVTGPTSTDVAQQRLAWSGHHLTRYAYVYEQTGFFTNLEGHRIGLVVLNDTVRSATDLTAGDSALANPAAFPTVDGLFDEAAAGIAAKDLTAITFDTTFGYPTRMDFSGPPDASGSILASDLALLP